MAASNKGDKYKPVREALGRLWDKLGLTGCCGGHGLVIGCPRCGRRWPRK